MFLIFYSDKNVCSPVAMFENTSISASCSPLNNTAKCNNSLLSIKEEPINLIEDDLVLDEDDDHLEVKEISSHKIRLQRIRDEMSSPVSEDVHDLVTPEEFMHSLGLLTVPQCLDIVEKRRERRKNNQNSHVFSPAIWEKSDTKRKKRTWLSSGTESPPQLRRKSRVSSQPSSRQTSRPGSPTGSSGSSYPSLSLSQPESPNSPDHTSLQTSSPICEEICPICKSKGKFYQININKLLTVLPTL